MKDRAQQVAELKELVKEFQAGFDGRVTKAEAEHQKQVVSAELYFKKAARAQRETPPTKRAAARKHHPHRWRGQGNADIFAMIYAASTGTVVRADDFHGFTDSPQRGTDNPGCGRHGGGR